MWAIPLATPREIFTLESQSSGDLPASLLPVNAWKQKEKKKLAKPVKVIIIRH